MCIMLKREHYVPKYELCITLLYLQFELQGGSFSFVFEMDPNMDDGKL